MSAYSADETEKIKKQLRDGIAQAEQSIQQARERLERKGFNLDSADLEAMLTTDPKIKEKYIEEQEKMQNEIEQERSRLMQAQNGSSAAAGTPRRKPMGSVKI